MCIYCGQTSYDGEQTGSMLQAGKTIRGTKLLAEFALLVDYKTPSSAFLLFSSSCFSSFVNVVKDLTRS